MTMIVAATIPAVTSCTDYDDYNEVRSDVNAGVDKTLWQNIVDNPELSEFADLVRRAGFDTELAGSKTYTVFAPVNDAIDETQYEGMDKDMLLKRFVKNHVANFNHAASGQVDERIRMLNNKSNVLQGAGSYTFGGLDIKTANIPGMNGVMHTLGDVLDYRDNIYDYIMQSTETTQLTDYLKKFEIKILDKENSVIAPIIDGKQTYLDSVIITRNYALTVFLGAQIENEDSSYTMLLPTDKAWQQSYDKIKGCFKYIANTPSQDILNSDKTADKDIPVTVMDDIDPALLQDSLSLMCIFRNLAFSNNNSYNRWIEDPKFTSNDTIQTTTRLKFSNPDEILGQTIEKIQLSNGVGRVVDSLAFLPWETYNSSVGISSLSMGLCRTVNGTPIRMEDVLVDKKYGVFEYGQEISYMLLQSPSKNAKPELDVCLPGVLSTAYNFYVVVVTPKVDSIQSVNGYNWDMPNSLNFTLNYSDAKGKLQNYKFSADGKVNPSKPTPFVNDTSKIDTLFLGKFEFPVCYVGLQTKTEEAVMPVLKITSSVNAFLETQKKKNTMDLRIASVILQP